MKIKQQKTLTSRSTR